MIRLIERVVLFCLHESLWWLVGITGWFAFLGWYYRGAGGHFLVLLYLGAVVFFLLPSAFYRHIVSRYGRVKRLTYGLSIVMVLAVFALHLAGQRTAAVFLFSYFLALDVGCMFWVVTSDLYEMVSWLSHPHEYGRPPDEIGLLAEVRDGDFINRLWRYRYGDEWDVGITGFVTFAFGDGQFSTMSPDEIVAEYRKWYEQEGFRQLEEEAIDKGFA